MKHSRPLLKLFSNPITLRTVDTQLGVIAAELEKPVYNEFAILNFLERIGLNPLRSGTKFVFSIIKESLDANEFKNSPCHMYDSISKKYGVSSRSISLAIARALTEAGDSGMLDEINQFFATPPVIGGHVSPGRFLVNVCYFLVSRRRDALGMSVDFFDD